MKLILNNKIYEGIKCDNFSRNLDVDNESVLFNIYFSTNNIADAITMSYLTQYANENIQSYKLYDENDELILNADNVNAKLISFNETFNNDYYNANASIKENKIINNEESE